MKEKSDFFAGVEGFEWDKGNIDKNRERHGVANNECEEIFFRFPLVVGEDERHSAREGRYYALGATDGGRMLFVVFTIRKNRIRVISARDMNRKERRVYETHAQEAPEIRK